MAAYFLAEALPGRQIYRPKQESSLSDILRSHDDIDGPVTVMMRRNSIDNWAKEFMTAEDDESGSLALPKILQPQTKHLIRKLHKHRSWRQPLPSLPPSSVEIDFDIDTEEEWVDKEIKINLTDPDMLAFYHVSKEASDLRNEYEAFKYTAGYLSVDSNINELLFSYFCCYRESLELADSVNAPDIVKELYPTLLEHEDRNFILKNSLQETTKALVTEMEENLKLEDESNNKRYAFKRLLHSSH